MVPPSGKWWRKLKSASPQVHLLLWWQKQTEETSSGDLVLWFLKRWQVIPEPTAPRLSGYSLTEVTKDPPFVTLLAYNKCVNSCKNNKRKKKIPKPRLQICFKAINPLNSLLIRISSGVTPQAHKWLLNCQIQTLLKYCTPTLLFCRSPRGFSNETKI